MTSGLTFYRRSAGEFAWVAAGQLLALVATAIGTKILTTQLGSVEYGRLTLGLTLATLLGQSIYGPFISALARLWSPYVESGHVDDLRAASTRWRVSRRVLRSRWPDGHDVVTRPKPVARQAHDVTFWAASIPGAACLPIVRFHPFADRSPFPVLPNRYYTGLDPLRLS